MTELWLVLGMAVVTFGIRYSLIGLSDRRRRSPMLTQLLAYVPPAVLTAIVVPAVLFPSGTLWVGYDNPRLVGAIAAILIAVWKRNLLLTIIFSLIFFLSYQALLCIH
ncbi:MAG: AzlD domain-containing protein [Leptolyngbya sp. SIO4C1]|nr:AzlD domain-containing protein [Leptolyngbya sp. SIO4C1]